MSMLDEPSSSRMLRNIDELFVSSLKDRLISDPMGPGILPVAVTCKNIEKKELFKVSYVENIPL